MERAMSDSRVSDARLAEIVAWNNGLEIRNEEKFEMARELQQLRAALKECATALEEAKPFVHDKSAIGMNGPNTACFTESHIDAALASARKLGA